MLSAVQEAVREIAKELTFEIELTSCEAALLEEVVPDMVRKEASEVLYEFELLQATEKLIDELLPPLTAFPFQPSQWFGGSDTQAAISAGAGGEDLPPPRAALPQPPIACARCPVRTDREGTRL